MASRFPKETRKEDPAEADETKPLDVFDVRSAPEIDPAALGSIPSGEEMLDSAGNLGFGDDPLGGVPDLEGDAGGVFGDSGSSRGVDALGLQFEGGNTPSGADVIDRGLFSTDVFTQLGTDAPAADGPPSLDRGPDQSTMMDDDSSDPVGDLIAGAMGQATGANDDVDIVGPTKAAAGQIEGDDDKSFLERMTLAQQGGWEDEVSDEDKARLEELAADDSKIDPPKDDKPTDDKPKDEKPDDEKDPPADPPKDDTTPSDPAPDDEEEDDQDESPDDGTQTYTPSEIDSTPAALLGRPGQTRIGDVINLGPEGEIDTPASLAKAFGNEDQWTTPSEDDQAFDPSDILKGTYDPKVFAGLDGELPDESEEGGFGEAGE